MTQQDLLEQTSGVVTAPRPYENEDLLVRLRGYYFSRWLLDEYFADEEREKGYEYAEDEHVRLEKKAGRKLELYSLDDLRLPPAVEIYSQVRQVSIELAALELGVAAKILDPQDFERRRRNLALDSVEYGANLRQASMAYDLVVDEHRRLLFWKKQEFAFEGDEKLWNYFWVLVRAAQTGGSISVNDFCDTTQRRNLADWKSRLGKLKDFPLDLHNQIDVRQGRHQLQVSTNRMCLFSKPTTPSGAPV